MNDQLQYIMALLQENTNLKSVVIQQSKDYVLLSNTLDIELKNSNKLIESFQNKESELKSLQNDSDFWKGEYEDAVKVLKRQLILNKGLKEDKTSLKVTINDLTNHVEQLRSDANVIKDKTVKYFHEKQEDHVTLTQDYHKLHKELIDMTKQRDELKATASGVQEDMAHWHGKYFDLLKENKEKSKVSHGSENKINLTQSEIDFLKSYLSQSLKDASESISNLKSDAKFYKHRDTTYSNSCYKDSEKMQKKANVLSGIQSKLKKTVLNRKTQATPQVNQEGYAEHKRAWIAVCDAIEVYCPGFLSRSGTGIECAVRAIHTFGKSNEQWNKLEGMMTLSLKGIK